MTIASQGLRYCLGTMLGESSTGRPGLVSTVERCLEGHGFELVELKALPRGGGTCVRILIDHLESGQAVTVGDCATVSRALRADPDVIEQLPEQHVLEVSSPGVDRPLTRPAHYRRYQGEQAVVRLRTPRDGRRSIAGTIAAASDSAVTLGSETGTVDVPYADIQSAHLKVDPWKPSAKH